MGSRLSVHLNELPDHYGQLYVTPDAPVEVIRAAYRSLRWTQDGAAGGEDRVIERIESAWRVLGDPARRAEYDAARRKALAVRTPVAGPAPSDTTPPAGLPESPAAPLAVPLTECAFCHAVVAPVDRRCAHCQAPLTRIAARLSRSPDGARGKERRRLPRVSRRDWGTLLLSPHRPGIDVRLRNLSPDGVSFFVGAPMAVGQRLRITSETFDAVLDVVHCMQQHKVYVVNGQFMTAIFGSDGSTP